MPAQDKIRAVAIKRITDTEALLEKIPFSMNDLLVVSLFHG
jgi:hypothetical protein